jgi:hypothetical protein
MPSTLGERTTQESLLTLMEGSFEHGWKNKIHKTSKESKNALRSYPLYILLAGVLSHTICFQFAKIIFFHIKLKK